MAPYLSSRPDARTESHVDLHLRGLAVHKPLGSAIQLMTPSFCFHYYVRAEKNAFMSKAT